MNYTENDIHILENKINELEEYVKALTDRIVKLEKDNYLKFDDGK